MNPTELVDSYFSIRAAAYDYWTYQFTFTAAVVGLFLNMRGAPGTGMRVSATALVAALTYLNFTALFRTYEYLASIKVDLAALKTSTSSFERALASTPTTHYGFMLWPMLALFTLTSLYSIWMHK